MASLELPVERVGPVAQPLMCGINGIFSYHYAANAVDSDELVRSRDYMAARGPDDLGMWIAADRRVALGHRRLSIIDLSEAGSQPMRSADGSLVITFNGEIYNYRELRLQLEKQGRSFLSSSDTEVLLHLYALYGAQMVAHLRGMFAFAIWDTRERSLFLARDPYGIKPLYYADDGWTFRFASQVKALLAGGAISREADPAGQVGFYLIGSVPEPFTTYQAVRALPAGSVLSVGPIGASEPRSYHSIARAFLDGENGATEPSTVEEVHEALRDSVRHHLVSDVPVGAFLSAGVDSGALVGLMRDVGQSDIQTVTLGFREFRGRIDDEVPLAERVAALCGTRHTTRIVTQSEFVSELPRIFEAMDQPTIDGINSWFVCKAANELGLKVAISGIGGDELFGGYPSFRDVPRWVRWLAAPSRIPGIGRASRALCRPISRMIGLSPKACGFLELGGTYAGAYFLRRGLYMPWELDQVLDHDTWIEGLRRLDPLRYIGGMIEPGPRCAAARVSTLESTIYMRNQLLRDADWSSMAHSLEVRVPLADTKLLSVVSRLDPKVRRAFTRTGNKVVLASAASVRLPAATERPKTGFSIPLVNWHPVVSDRVSDGSKYGSGREWARMVASGSPSL